MAEFISDEGHVFSDEDTIFLIKWKVSDLKAQGFSDDYILNFDYCDGWEEYARDYLQEINLKIRHDKIRNIQQRMAHKNNG